MKTKIDVTEILQWREENKATLLEAARHFLVSYNRLGKAITRFNKGEKNVLLEQQASTLSSLLKKKQELEAEIKQARQQEREQVIEQVKKTMQEYGLNCSDLTGIKVMQKYKNPVTGETWSGRGKTPKWIQGKDRSQFLVKESKYD